MRILPSLLGAVVLGVVLAPVASAATGFDDVQVIGSGPVGYRPVAAVNDRGERAVAWIGGRIVTVARRGGTGGGWTLSTLPRAAQVRELQLVLTAQGDTVAAWQERGRVRAAVARRGGPFVVQSLSRPGSHGPRVAALADGRVALVLGLLNTPRVAITSSGDALVVWSDIRRVPGPPAWDILVARSPRDSPAFGAPEVLGPGPDRHGRSAGSIGVALTSYAEHLLAAWRAPGPSGGVAIATGR